MHVTLTDGAEWEIPIPPTDSTPDREWLERYALDWINNTAFGHEDSSGNPTNCTVFAGDIARIALGG